ncbi:amidohydrolase [Rhodobacteraceae bacterium LMO-12]|nr:amidohydrolase [Rhodobacteraceae bacterium LMO-JJ12]
MGAGKITGLFAAPEGWRQVLLCPEFNKLRVNLAHFGRFKETAPNAAMATKTDWEDTIAGMLSDFTSLYFDLGFCLVATDPDNEDHELMMERMGDLIARFPLIKERMMYGSDWSMTGRIPGHQTYSARVVGALGELGFSGSHLKAVMGGNAARFLGLSDEGDQHARLAVFYEGHPIFEELFLS